MSDTVPVPLRDRVIAKIQELKAANWSPTRIASESGVSEKTVSRWAQGKNLPHRAFADRLFSLKPS